MRGRVVVSSVCGVLFGLMSGTAIPADPMGVQFSADTYEKSPQGEVTGKIFFGDGKVRYEMTQAGQKIIRIIDSARNTTWIVYPAQKSFTQFKGAAGPASANGDSAGGERNPCEGMEGATCSRMGEEEVHGRVANKWRVEFSWQGKQYTTTQWIDKARGLTLKSDSGTGQVMEQRVVGREKIGGRDTEKWESTVKSSNQPPQTTVRWFDPELNLTVREEVPGKFVREMRNIRVAPQDPALFSLPAGYKQVEAPASQPPRR